VDELLQKVASDPEKIDSLIYELHRIAKAEDVYEYGLPIYTSKDSLRLAVINWIATVLKDIEL
jgi:hypothetical protein